MGLPRFDFTAGTALVTGAAGGIGAQLALGLARRGSDLVLLDIDTDGLAAVREAVSAAGSVDVSTHVVDVADRAALLELAGELAQTHPDLHLLVNNAGVALGGHFEHLTLEEFDWVMDVNFRAPVALVHALLPTLRATAGAHIVNMSSLFGLITPAGQSAYSSSKFALRGFSEVLRAELGPAGVGVTTVHPGGVRTSIATSARIAAGAPADEVVPMLRQFDKLLRYPPDKAAEEIL
nr:SDR family oxidoreductase [Candidatus Nanopelagicales bacterium]